MSMYFCDDCQCFHDDDWIPMEGDNLCGEAVEKRKEALREMIAKGVAEHIEQTESRHVH